MAIVFYLNLSFEENVLVDDKPKSPKEDRSLVKETTEYERDEQLKVPSEGLANLLGKDTSFLKSMLGHPIRIDPSEYEYDWWIYKRGLTEYIQVGVENNRVVTLYAIGPEVNIAPFKIGQPVQEIYTSVSIEPSISLQFDGSSYRFELNEDDMNTRPLVQMGDFFIQFYIDKFDGTLSSVRYMDAKTLIKLQPYELVYLGELIEVNPTEKAEEELISQGSSQQIFDITNMIRVRHELNPLELDENVSKVALAHSIDMYTTEDFSHTSKVYGELSDRLEAGDVFYQTAGENIAASYSDAPAVMEGWLNSKAHRETLLNEQYTHLGVGVYNKHYTQNFIQKWEE